MNTNQAPSVTHAPDNLQRGALSVAVGSADRRLRGLQAAQRAINSFIKEARAACEPYGPRQGRKLEWWRGQFDGLVAAKAMLALADFPDQPDNAAQIEKLLPPNTAMTAARN
jgi:hypothetical protein